MSPPFLPQELLVEILSWVPVKDLMRFRCVSKSWNSLVFDPTFVKLHLQRSPKNTHVLLTFEDYTRNRKSRYCAPCSIHALLHNPSSTIDACQPFNHNYSVLAVCNGLVCLLDFHRGDGFIEYWVRFWNPATRVMSQDSPRTRLSMGGYLYMFGFGYDDWSDTYQVILLDNKPQKMEAKVYSLCDTSWRNVLSCPAFSTRRLHGASVSGTVNWLGLRKSSSDGQWTMNDLVIFSYDLKNETYRYLSMPDSLFKDPPPDRLALEVLKGCLCLCHHRGTTHFDFWLMREFGVEKSWTHFLTISYEQLHNHGHIHGFPAFPQILCMSENDDAMLLAKGGCRKFILYNKRDNRIDHYGDFDKGFVLAGKTRFFINYRSATASSSTSWIFMVCRGMEGRKIENSDHCFFLPNILSALVFLFMLGLVFLLLHHMMEFLIIYNTVAYALLHGIEKGSETIVTLFCIL